MLSASKEQILKKIGNKRKLIIKIKTKRLKYLEHIMGKENLENLRLKRYSKCMRSKEKSE